MAERKIELFSRCFTDFPRAAENESLMCGRSLHDLAAHSSEGEMNVFGDKNVVRYVSAVGPLSTHHIICDTQLVEDGLLEGWRYSRRHQQNLDACLTQPLQKSHDCSEAIVGERQVSFIQHNPNDTFGGEELINKLAQFRFSTLLHDDEDVLGCVGGMGGECPCLERETVFMKALTVLLMHGGEREDP